MNQATEQDLGPLTWVKSEIDQALAKALDALSQAAENAEERGSKLQFAQTHLHQARGALSIIGLDGLTQFADGLDKLMGDLARGDLELTEDVLDLCRRAIAATGNYLDELSHGATDQPLRLAPLHARIAIARGVEAPSEGDLFYPSTQVRIPKRPVPQALNESDEQRLLRWFRLQFQQGLLGWLRKPDDPAGARQMREAVVGIESRQSRQQDRALWLSAAAFCEALSEGHVPVTAHIRRICGRIDAQIRRLVSGATHFPERLHRDTLYVVAKTPATSPLVKALHSLYRLPDQLPPPNSSVSELPLAPMLAELREQLNHAKDTWDQFAEGAAAALPAFEERMSKLATASRKLGRPAFVRLMSTLSAFAQWLRKDPMRANDAMSMEVASALLLADHALDSGRVPDASFSSQVEDAISRIEACSRGEKLDSSDAAVSARQAQERSAVAQLCKEVLASLGLIEQTLDGFFRAPEKRELLAGAKAPMAQISGILTLLDENEAGDILSDCEAMVDRLADPDQPVDTELFEPLADLLSGLGFYIDSLARGRPERHHLTGEMEEEDSADEVALAPPELAPAADEAPVLPAAAATLPDTPLKGNEGRIEHEEDLPDAPLPVPETSAEAAQLLEASDEEIDAELLDIFIEEAREVLGNIDANLRATRANPNDTEALTTVRRGFHTLKGSGRMVGLNALGEVAWDLEQTLNRWLQHEWTPSPAVLDLIGDAHTLFSAWVEQLAAGGPTGRTDTGPICARAQQLLAVDRPDAVLEAPAAEPAAETTDAPPVEPPPAESPATAEPADADLDLDLDLDMAVAADAPAEAGDEDTTITDLDVDILADEDALGAPSAEQDAPPARGGNLNFSDLEATNLSFDTGFEDLDEAPPPADFDPAQTVIEPLEALEDADTPAAIDFPELVDEEDTSDAAAEPPSVEGTPVDTPQMPETIDERTPEETVVPVGEASELEFDLSELESEPAPALDAEQDEAPAVADETPEAAETDAADADDDTDGDALDLDLDMDLSGALAEAAPTTTPETDAPSEAFDEIEIPSLDSSDENEAIDLPSIDAPIETPDDTAEAPARAAEEAAPAEPEAPVEAGAPADVDSDTVTVGTMSLSRGLYDLYVNESRDHVAHLRQEAAQLAINPTRIPTEESMRAAHTLAGISGTAGFDATQHLGRALEHALGRLHETRTAPTAEQTALITTAADTLDAMVSEIQNGSLPLAAPVLEAQLDSLLRTPIIADTTPAAEDFDTEPADTTEALDAAVEADAEVDTTPESVPEAAPEPAPEPSPEPEPALAVQDDIDESLLPIFVEEAQELLSQLNAAVREWRSEQDNDEHRATLARLLHTIKGSARMTGAMTLGEHLHALEGRLEAAPGASPELFDELEQSLDVTTQYVERLARGETPSLDEAADDSAEAGETSPTAAQQAVAIETEDAGGAGGGTLRVRADLVDRFVNEAGEIGIARTRIEGELRTQRRALLDLTENVIRLRNQLREVEIQADIQMQSRIAQAESHHANFDPLEMDRYTRLQELTRMMAESVNDVTTVQHTLLRNLDQADAALIAQSRQTRTLQQALMSVRMTPFDSLADRLYRVVRQSAKDLGKRANLELRGGRIELDRSVLERITGPLEHLLRNAVAHGIESPDLRQTAGKPEIGEIRLTVRHEGNEVVVEMTDDGAGLNFGKIEARARAAGLLADGESVDERRLTNMIFMPGFSTAGELSAISGRGVGMDVVKSETAAVGGRIEVTSQSGQGSVFRLYLPLTLAVTQALLVQAGGRTYAIPSNMVAQVMELKPDALAEIQSAGTTTWLGDDYPYTYLPRLLGDQRSEPQVHRFNWVLLLRSGTQTLAVHVDTLRGNQEIVVKKAGPQLARLVGYTGATVLGDGEIVLIINPVALAGVAAELSTDESAPAITRAEPVHTPTVMVVDDSLTVRKITGRLLEREGYTVVTAKDGVDALEHMLDELPDVILSDIEMPRMDGFDLARNIRNDERLKQVPIIMITSRLADKHREFAREIGVNHYLGKPYQEDELLELITRYAGVPANR